MADPVRVLVVGGTGGVGEGIVRALLAQREHISGIAVSSRDGEKLARLHRSIDLDPLVTTVVGDVGTMNSARELRDAVRALGRIDVAIASIGGCDAFHWPSELLETNGPITIMRRRGK